MIRQVLRAAAFRRDSYLRAVLASGGTADAVVIVAAVYLALALTVSPRGLGDLLGHARFVLDGGIAWLVLSGIVYLVARHGLRGEGSYQGVLAVTALAHPPLLLLALAQLPAPIPLSAVAPPTLVVLEAWRFALVPSLVVTAAGAWFLAALVAGTRVAMGLALDRAVPAVLCGYVGWWAAASLLRF